MAFRRITLVLSLAVALAAGFSADAFARPGAGSSFGSRGSRTFSAPPPTQTAPRGAAPMERSMTQPGQNSFASALPGQRRGWFPGGFGSGLMGGLLGGLVGAGLFGLLFGHGMFGGLGGFASILGLLLQIGLLFLLFKFVMGFLRGRRPAFQGAAFDGAGIQGGPRPFAGFGGSGGGASPASRAQGSTRLELSPADFDAFEKRLVGVQTAYSAEDVGTLRSLVTPEMASYFVDELDANSRKGLVNRISDVKFLQGDLSEAWREQAGDYATVAVRFSLIDTTVDRATGRLVSGNPTVPQTATEVWTFTRPNGSSPAEWKLSAIQQA